jgi:dynein heavy chain 1
LKKLFRQIAMTKPDPELIAQVMLFAQGFRHAELLAKKVVPLFNRCSDELSSQPHYDFGLRALKSVLVSAGGMKRDVGTNQATEATYEQQIMIQSIRETVSPKLVGGDVATLIRVLSETFPGVEYVPANTEKLLAEIQSICAERRLLVEPQWVEKVIQLYQIQNIHHGLMMVGPAGSGKSAVWSVLLAALEKIDGHEGLSYVIDPKAISKEHLYGTLDPTTREWTDGLFTHILRKIVDNVRGESNKRHWIIFDGDVDPVRILCCVAYRV